MVKSILFVDESVQLARVQSEVTCGVSLEGCNGKLNEDVEWETVEWVI